MQSVLTVVTPADSQDLTILSTVKAELGITGTSEDANIELWIDQVSGAIAAYCNRVFGRETVMETFRAHHRHERLSTIVLDRFPVTNIASLVDDTVTLVEGTDFEADYSTGTLYRLKTDRPTFWHFSKVAVTYTGGYQLLGTLPQPVERAAITMVKLARASATRDPALRSENILSGLYSYTLFGPNDQPDGLPADVKSLLDAFKSHQV